MQIVHFMLMLFFTSSLFAKECVVDDRIMYAIAEIEGHRDTPVGYPYLISINSKKDKLKAKRIKELAPYFLDSRTIDCQGESQCTSLLSILNSNGIFNLDLGSFQINELYWKMDKRDYFNIKKSYHKACEIVMSHNKMKWSWENIAKYHSKTKSHNLKYKKYLLAKIEKQD